MIDTHAHIYLKEFRDDLDEIISHSQSIGISKIYMPNIDCTTIDDMLEVESRYPDYCIPMMGLHPGSVKENFEKDLYVIEEWLSKRPFAAVGEIGIDLYWDKTFEEFQKEAFRYQIGLAKHHHLPIVIHNRNAFEETYSIVNQLNDDLLYGIFHCFTGSVAEAEKIVNLGFHLGIGGVVTYKNGGLDKVLPHVDLSHLVLETDSPYLTPVPFRGKRNSPVYVQYVIDKISSVINLSKQNVINITTQNAEKIFGRRTFV